MVRHTYAEVHERARLCALALRRLGVEQSDRVATIAWNTWRHLECWSAPSIPSLQHRHPPVPNLISQHIVPATHNPCKCSSCLP